MEQEPKIKEFNFQEDIDKQQQKDSAKIAKQFTRIPRFEKRKQKHEKTKIKKAEDKKKLVQKKKNRWGALTYEQKLIIFEQRKSGEEKLKIGYQEGLEVYVDMEYDILMEPREIRSLALQMAKIVGANKDLQLPVSLHLTNYKGLQQIEMEKQGGKNWLVHKHEDSLDDLVRNNKTQKEFIYLSPDADEELDTVDPKKYIYVVGGFVDRTVQKFMSLNKAGSLQICSYRLPINKFIKGRQRPLNIDIVVCILSEFYSCQNWREAYEKANSRNEGLISKLYKENVKEKLNIAIQPNEQSQCEY